MRRPSAASQPSRQHRAQTLGALLNTPGALRERQTRAGLACVPAPPSISTMPVARPEPSSMVNLLADDADEVAPPVQLVERRIRGTLTLRPTTGPAASCGLQLDDEPSGWATASEAELRSAWASAGGNDVHAAALPLTLPLTAQPSSAADRSGRSRTPPQGTRMTADSSGLELASARHSPSPVPQRRVHDASTIPARRTGLPTASPNPQRSAARRQPPTLPRCDDANKAKLSTAERQLLSALGDAIPWHISDLTGGARQASSRTSSL
jgi:hypothetical protein